MQHDTQAKGKGMPGLTTRKGKGNGAQVAKETVFDQTAIGICEGRIRCVRSMVESAKMLRDQGGFATPADELQKWTNGLELLVQELGILKKGVDRDLPGDEEDMEDEPEIDPEGYLAGQRRWKVDPNVSLGDKIQRSLTREAKLFKAQARMQSEVEKLVWSLIWPKRKSGRGMRVSRKFSRVWRVKGMTGRDGKGSTRNKSIRRARRPVGPGMNRIGAGVLAISQRMNHGHAENRGTSDCANRATSGCPHGGVGRHTRKTIRVCRMPSRSS